MNFDRIKSLLGRDGRQTDDVRAEGDTSTDHARVDSRVTGGVPDESDPNQGSTTSSSQNGEYVGRIAGDDVGYAGETGAERRAQADDDS